MKHEELTLELACRQIARQAGWAAFKNEKNGNKGVPDDTFVHPSGAVFFVEFKTLKGRISKEQRWWLEHFNHVYVVRDVETFKSLLTAYGTDV